MLAFIWRPGKRALYPADEAEAVSGLLTVKWDMLRHSG